MLVKKNWAEARFHRDRFNRWWEQNAHTLNFPMVYLGDEPNTYKFDWDQDDAVLDSTFKILFATPNSYVTAVGNAALPLFYQELHEYNPDWVIERGYFPSDRSEYDKFDKAGIVPFSFEGKMPYSAFDVLCFTQSVAGQELHIIDDLIRSGIAPKWQERKEEDPIIIRGGCNSFNPSNIKDVCDIYYIGEGEDGVPQLLEFIEKGLREGKSKEEILLGAANLRDGLWVPRFYEERYDEDGNLVGMFCLRDDVPEKIRKDYIRDLDNTFIYTKPVVTFLDPGMSAGEVEITRGCHGGCSFAIAEGSLIETSEGIVPVEEFAGSSGVNEGVEFSLGVLTDTGVDTATKIFYRGEHPTMKVSTVCGYELVGTPDHEVRVLRDGEYLWSRIDDLHDGDRLAVVLSSAYSSDPVDLVSGWVRPTSNQRGFYTKNKWFAPYHEMTPRLAEFLGYAVGDGYYEDSVNPGVVQLTVAPAEYDDVKLLMDDLWSGGYRCKYDESNGVFRFVIQSKVARSWLRYIGLRGKGRDKRVPWSVMRSSVECRRGFLRGLFGADGCVAQRSACFGTYNVELSKEVQVLLASCGILTSRCHKASDGLDFWEVYSIGSDAARKFSATIGFTTDRKNEKLRSSLDGARVRKARNVEFLPEYPDSAFVLVSSVEYAGVRKVYDFVADKVHQTFVSNGITIHNCQEGSTYLPYRERSVDVSMEALKTSQMYGGSPDVLPSAFCSSTYSSVKTILKRTLEEVSDEISLISQRVDEFAGDPNFVQLTSFAGNKTVSLGVEGNSQRMRDAVSKNCTTEQIIEAVRLAYIYGYQKIKLFMIANLPGETPEDVAEVVDLARQLREMLDANKIEGKAFPRITFSWTPLSIQPFTPYQWCKPPIGERSLGDVLKPIKEYGFRVRIGGNSGSSAAEKIIQLTQRADARLQDLFIELAKNGVTYFGGMPAKALDITEKYFRTHGLPGWDYWFRQCSEDNVFPWDFIDIGVKKEYLWKRYLVATAEEPHPFTKCLDGCNNCGVCHKEDYKRYSQYRKQEAEDKEVDVSRIVPAYQTGNVQRLILKIETDEKHRFVGVDHWRFAVRRAFMLAGIPVSKKSITMASGVVPYRDWSYGVDYVSCNLVEKQSDVAEIIERLNEYACNFKVVDARLYPYTGATVRNSMDLAYYEMEIDQDVNTARARIREVLDSTTWVVPIKKEGFMGTQTEEVDVRGWVEDLWMANEGGKLMLRMKIRGELSPYVVYQNLFNLSWKKAGKYPARRIDIFLKVDETSDDMFRPRCEECNRHIEVNIFDNPVDQFLCYKDQDKENGVYVE